MQKNAEKYEAGSAPLDAQPAGPTQLGPSDFEPFQPLNEEQRPGLRPSGDSWTHGSALRGVAERDTDPFFLGSTDQRAASSRRSVQFQ